MFHTIETHTSSQNAFICCVHKASKPSKVDQDSSEQNTAIHKNLRTVKIIETHTHQRTLYLLKHEPINEQKSFFETQTYQ